MPADDVVAMTEAYFVGLVFEHHGEQDWRFADYYTLELSVDLETDHTLVASRASLLA